MPKDNLKSVKGGQQAYTIRELHTINPSIHIIWGKGGVGENITLQGGCRTIVLLAGCISLLSEAPECVACSVPTIVCSS